MPENIARCRWQHVFSFLFFVCFVLVSDRMVKAAEVTIDSTVSTTTTSHNGSNPTTVFISDQTGYTFYIDSSGTCVYRKTTDGGTNWGASVTVDSQTDCLGVGVWYDRWTPGDATGTLIHVVTFDSGSDDLWYSRFDTSDDSLTTTVNATGVTQGGSFTSGANLPAITKGTDGVIYVGIQDGSDSFLMKSPDGTTWDEAGTNPFDLADDFLILMPLSGGKIMAIRWDISADDIQSKVFNGSTWDASWTNIDTNAADNTSYDGAFGATADKTTGNIYLVYAADIVSLGTNDDIRTAVYAGGSWASKSNVLTDDTKGITGAKIFFDENTGNVSVVYSARGTAGTANTGNVYWAKSTDKMVTWGAAQGPVNTTADDIYGVRINSMSNERIYITWYGAAPDDLFGITLDDLIPPIPPPPPPRLILTVDSTIPSDGATDVAINTSVSATFSLLMNGSTLTTDTFQLKDGSDKVGGEVTTQTKTATFLPSGNLNYNTTYTARVTTEAQAANFEGTTLDNDYLWSFTTTSDAEPPTVSFTSPLNGADGVSMSSTITATFSEEMQEPTVNTRTFTVSDGRGNIGGVVSYRNRTATFTPFSTLSDSTTYTARITTGVKDFAGNAMSADYAWSFTSVDITMPVVSSTNPANGAVGVAMKSTITVTFSEEMQTSTLNTDTFIVSDGKGSIGGVVSYRERTATFIPSGTLSDSITYTARITTGVKDLAGNAMNSDYVWSFTTVDTTRPVVSSTNPPHGAAGVAINSTITAVFSEAMLASTIHTDTFTVSDGNSSTRGTVSYRGITATFTPSGSLLDSTLYTARISTGVKDLTGNALASDYTWSFTTGDFIAPEVISTNPAKGAIDVPVHTTIVASFSEVMQAATINTNTFTVSDGMDNIGGMVSYGDMTAVFTPSGSLSDSTTYTARITTGVKDLAGNAMNSDYVWSFVTVDTTRPVVRSTNPSHGAAGVAINSTITATFSEEMQASTIHTHTFTVSDGNSNTRGTVSYRGITATFTPSDNLFHSTIYTATITTEAKDLAGNSLANNDTWNFTTTGDVLPPMVSATSPVNGDANVAMNRSIIVMFSEFMQPATITPDTFTVSDGDGNISGMISYQGISATFTPSGNLLPYTTYTARISTGVRDLAGNAMGSPYTWSFKTSGDIDILSPKVRSTSPLNGAAGVDVSSIITATFSEELDVSTITTDTYVVNDGSGYVSGTVSCDDTTAIFTPVNNLSSYTSHTARILKGVKDLAGNALVSDYVWSFITGGDLSAPTISSTNPANGAAGVDVSAPITATFSEEMDSASINPDTILVNNGSNDIHGMVSYSKKTATFSPYATLDFHTIYTTTITTGTRDLSGNQLASAYTWSFITESVSHTPTPGHTVTPTPEPTETPVATLTPLPTPSGCNIEKIGVFPGKLQLEKDETDVMTVTLTGVNDCPVEGETVKAKITSGKRRISVSPTFAITNHLGQAAFTITAMKKTGNAKVKFKSGNFETIGEVKIAKK